MDITGYYGQLKKGSDYVPANGLLGNLYEHNVFYTFGAHVGPLLMPSFIANMALGLPGGSIEWMDDRA